MAFTISDFYDLLHLLEQQPEWRAELRRLLLTEELLSLPQAVKELTEQVVALAEAQRRTEAQMVALTHEVQLLTRRVDSLSQSVGYLKGTDIERRYQERAPGYFQSMLRRIYVFSPNELSILLDDAVNDEKLSLPEADEIIRADVIIKGRRRTDLAECYLVVEVSWGIGPYDVERAAKRAEFLAKLGFLTIPVVAGEEITYEAASMAKALRVWQVLDGRAISPFDVSEFH